MALYKVTVKRSMSHGSQRLEAGMSAEVSWDQPYSLCFTKTVIAEVKRQFKMKYNVDLPDHIMNFYRPYLDIEKL